MSCPRPHSTANHVPGLGSTAPPASPDPNPGGSRCGQGEAVPGRLRAPRCLSRPLCPFEDEALTGCLAQPYTRGPGGHWAVPRSGHKREAEPSYTMAGPSAEPVPAVGSPGSPARRVCRGAQVTSLSSVHPSEATVQSPESQAWATGRMWGPQGSELQAQPCHSAQPRLRSAVSWEAPSHLLSHRPGGQGS